MLRNLTAFLKSDRGAVTVDWVLLTSVVVVLAAVTVVSVRDGSKGLGDRTGTWLDEREAGSN